LENPHNIYDNIKKNLVFFGALQTYMANNNLSKFQCGIEISNFSSFMARDFGFLDSNQ